MGGAAKALLPVMLDRLKSSEVFSSGVRGRVLDAEAGEPPCAWVGITGPADPTVKPEELYATVHIWRRSGDAEVDDLVIETKRLFEHPPAIDGFDIIGWALDFSAVRRSEDDAAYHGLVRFKIRARSA